MKTLRILRVSPQFYLVFDNYFETVHSSNEDEPLEWSELLTFNRFKSDYDEDGFVPELDKEWLSIEEQEERMKREENRKEKKEESKDVFYDSRDEITSQRELLENNDSEPLINEENIESIQAESEPLYNERESIPLRRSTRIRKEPTRFTFNKQHGYLTVKGICMKVVKSLILAFFIQ